MGKNRFVTFRINERKKRNVINKLNNKKGKMNVTPTNPKLPLPESGVYEKKYSIIKNPNNVIAILIIQLTFNKRFHPL